MKKKIIILGLFITLLSGCVPNFDQQTTSKKRDRTEHKTGNTEKVKRDTSKNQNKNKITEKETAADKNKTRKKSETSNEKIVPGTKNKTGKIFSSDDDEEVSYKSEDGTIAAVFPDYSRYQKEQVLEILGEPSQVITDSEEIKKRLKNKELDIAKSELAKGKLTESQAKAFMFASLYVNTNQKLEALIYEDQGKPNVYLSEKGAEYISPITEYIDFKGKIPLK